MRHISFVATRPTSKFKIGAMVIMKILGTDYSHVAVIFHGSNGRRYPYEANGHTGVNFVGHDIWSKRNRLIMEFSFDFADQHFEEILDYAMGMCGTDYGFLQNIGIKLCDWIPFIKKNPFTTGKNCSELVKKIAVYAGIDIADDDNLVTPRQAIDFLRAAVQKREAI